MTSSSSTLRRAHNIHPKPKWDEAVPPILRPLLRAYVLGYASSVGPRVVTLILQRVTPRRPRSSNNNRGGRPKSDDGAKAAREQDQPPFLQSLRRVLQCGFDLRRFPAFCAALMGGTTLLEYVILKALPRLFSRLSGVAIQRISRLVASVIAAWFSLRLLQSKNYDSYSETTTIESESESGPEKKVVTRYAGRTLDLTIFTACRAVDVVVGELWAQRWKRRTAANRWTRFESTIGRLTDPAMFAASSAAIMWAWFYRPSHLPRAYHKWISSAAAVDPRLIEALQQCRRGELQYGHTSSNPNTSKDKILQSMCADYNWPLTWGDPSKSIPFPCEMVHMGCGPSCEYHALSRFARTFKWAMATYLPLNLLILTKRRDVRAVVVALRNAARSSAFLGAFVALFYYGVCLARTRVGPRLLGLGPSSSPSPSDGNNNDRDEHKEKATRARQRIDSGICVAAGCLLCGWSILLEKPGRVANMALFVAPRALATVLPRRYPLRFQEREALVFALSAAAVLTCARENPGRVRGVLGKVLGLVLAS